jgi:hypothetical protein
MRKIDLNVMTHFSGDFKRCEHTILGKIVPGKIKIKNLLYCGDTRKEMTVLVIPPRQIDFVKSRVFTFTENTARGLIALIYSPLSS